MEANTTTTNMRYRYLGNSGIRVSVLGWGNWINVSNQDDITTKTVKRALELGINFFDTAEIYGFGEAEKSLGTALAELKVRRESIIVTTKIFKCGLGLNDTMLSRKHITEAVNNSLKRLQLDYVDVVFCHRFDDDTPLEEVCRGMNAVINSGKAFYWATSEWKSSQIMDAFRICDLYGLARPIADQCQYNMMERNKMESDYTYLFDKYSYGTTIWSPLFSGVLTGKYRNSVEEEKDSRLVKHDQSGSHKRKYLAQKEQWDAKIDKLTEIAKTLGCSMAQLAIAWTIKSPNTSTCILGTSRVEQLDENIKALDVVEKIDAKLEEEIDQILGNAPEAELDWKTFTPKDRRRIHLDKLGEWKKISQNIKK